MAQRTLIADATTIGMPCTTRPRGWAYRTLAIMAFVVAIALCVPRIALADELLSGVLTITEDIWSMSAPPDTPSASLPSEDGEEQLATPSIDEVLSDVPVAEGMPESAGTASDTSKSFFSETDDTLADAASGSSSNQFDETDSDVSVADANLVGEDSVAESYASKSGSMGSDDLAPIDDDSNAIATLPNHEHGPADTVDAVYSDSIDAEAARTKVSDKLTNENWVADAVNAREAWDIVKSNGSVAVAIIDSGIDLSHPDLAANIVATYNSYDGSRDVNDEIGHGTHVAGIVSGVANNAYGLTGISYDAKLVIIKASTTGTNSFEIASIVRAYDWLLEVGEDGLTNAERFGVRVVNLSIGGLDDTYSSNCYDDQIVKAMARARAQGILTVCAAGNKGTAADPYLCYPGDSDVCLSVMNLRKTDDGYDLSDTSNYNIAGTDYKDVCAPGTTIYSTWKDGLFVIQSGTSMAAPLVSGVAALMFAANPTLTPALAMDLIELSCVDLGESGWDERFGYGMVDAEAAVRLANQMFIEGPSVVGVGSGAHTFKASGYGNQANESGWTWTTSPADAFSGGSALVDAAGRVAGLVSGNVVVRATCTTPRGAELTLERLVRVIEGAITGVDTLSIGESCSYFVANALDLGESLASLGWAWLIDEGTGVATIDADGLVTALAPGVATLRAICTTNSALSFTKRLLVAA